jgi:hemerythrin
MKTQTLIDYPIFIEWNPDFNLDIPIIDAQHQGLVSAINSLHFAMVNEFGEDMLESIISMVREYTRFHFMTEETIFRTLGFPGTERHVELHNKQIEAMLEIGQESMFSQNPGSFLRFLGDWLTRHILREDRAYRDYFLRSGQDGAESNPVRGGSKFSSRRQRRVK